MLQIGTKVKIIDNLDEHVGYVPNTIGTIIEIDEYDNYILDIGYCTSEAELEIL